jgi:hypothetical protein
MPLPYVWRQGQKLLASGAESFGGLHSRFDSRTRARRTPSHKLTWKPFGDLRTLRTNTTLSYLYGKRPSNFPLYTRPTTRTEAAFSRRPHRRPAVHTLMWKGSCTAAHSSSQRAWCDQLRLKMNGAQSTDNESGQNSVKKPDKPLRFVTNYGAPHPKRRRIGAACLTCRKRKTACSGKDGSR